MNKSDVAASIGTHEVAGGDRPALVPAFSQSSMGVDLSRPPQPGSFRFSLEEMRCSASSVSGRTLPHSSGQAPVENPGAAHAVSRRLDKQDAVSNPSERQQLRLSEEETGRTRRSAETRVLEPAPPTDREPTCIRPEDASGTVETAHLIVAVEQQADAAVVEGNGQLPQETTAVLVSGGESAAEAVGGDGGSVSFITAATGLPSGDADATQTVPQPVAEEERVPQTDPSAKPVAAQPVYQERAGGSKKNVAAPPEKMPFEKQDGGAGKSDAVPLSSESAKAEAAVATATRAHATASAKAAPVNAAMQPYQQTTPAAAPRETVASPAQASEGMTVVLKESSAGRVVRIGADTQSGQTGLFQAHQGPTGSDVQVGSSTSAPQAPGQPFQYDLLQQVTEKTVFHLKNGRVEAHIDLKPESLGHLRLHVATDNGQVTLKIMTESGWVRDIIESNISQLKSELQQHNLQIDRLDVSVSGGGQESAGGHSQTADSPRTPADAAGTGRGGAAPDTGEGGSQHPPMRRRREGLVDYFA